MKLGLSVNVVSSIPKHLHKYIVEQNYERYTSEDQEVWRFVMAQLQSYLTIHAHTAYASGLKLTGITMNEIPKISVMDEKLKNFGWRAVPVSGFIPPAAFMEFQARGILPIACDMRTIDHILYTPAPDIVHEAAGHAPILVDPEFSQYLKNYAEVASKAIISSEDLNVYEAIRNLSDIKEAPESHTHEILQAEENLKQALTKMSFVSEAQLLGRMNWWTAEYGLIGDIRAPKIFGAGLLSSIGESRLALKKPKLLPLTSDCLSYSYDITEQQPQLFVADNFITLNLVLKNLADSLAYKVGGTVGLQKAVQAQTVCTVILEAKNLYDIRSYSGILKNYTIHENSLTKLEFKGPVQISINDQRQLDVSETLILNFNVQDNFKVNSVHGGPIDSASFPSTEDFIAARVPLKKRTSYDLKKFELYQQLKLIRTKFDADIFKSLKNHFTTEFSFEWLLGLGLIEIACQQKGFESDIAEIMNHFSQFVSTNNDHKLCIDLGLNLLKQKGLLK